MVRPAQTARSERTRDALRRAALVRFLAQGVEDTSAEQIADDAGVSLRTFYRHFADKREVLFGGQDALRRLFADAITGAPESATPVEAVAAALEAAAAASAAQTGRTYSWSSCRVNLASVTKDERTSTKKGLLRVKGKGKS